MKKLRVVGILIISMLLVVACGDSKIDIRETPIETPTEVIETPTENVDEPTVEETLVNDGAEMNTEEFVSKMQSDISEGLEILYTKNTEFGDAERVASIKEKALIYKGFEEEMKSSVEYSSGFTGVELKGVEFLDYRVNPILPNVGSKGEVSHVMNDVDIVITKDGVEEKKELWVYVVYNNGKFQLLSIKDRK